MIMKRQIKYFLRSIVIMLFILTTKNVFSIDTQWRLTEGNEDKLCKGIYDNLKKINPKDIGQCTGEIALEYPGINLVDGWNELEVSKYSEFYKKLMQYTSMGVNRYFGRDTRRPNVGRLDESLLEKKYQNFLKNSGKMRVIHLQLFKHPLGSIEKTYNWPQTIVELSQKRRPFECPAVTKLVYDSRLFYVSPDMSGPDPDINSYEASYYLSRNTNIVTYNGNVMLISSDGLGISIYRNNQYHAMERFCVIRR